MAIHSIETAKMKERITYIRDNQDEFHPGQLEVGNNSMHIKSLKAAKEHRLTFDFSQLPTEVCPAG